MTPWRFEASDAELAAAVQAAHLPSLRAALVHLTGDSRWLAQARAPVYDFFGDGQGGFDALERRQIEADAISALKAYRARGYTLPKAPSLALLQSLMGYVAGCPIPDDYLAFLQEELGIPAADHAPHACAALPDVPNFHVAIIGAGMSGLLAGVTLKRAGIPFTIYEARAALGGTWEANRYPGCRVDSPNHLYAYKFAPKNDWPMHFSQQQDLLSYFNAVANQEGVRAHIRFEARVEHMAWDEKAKHWQLRVRTPEGLVEVHAQSVISAVGQLNQPKIPGIKGQETYKGRAFHSACWPAAGSPEGLSLEGKRVAVVGTGASAFQIVPALVDTVERLDVYQRSPPWLGPTPGYHESVTPEQQWLLDHVPYYSQWYRFWLFWMLTDGVLPSIQADPAWQDGGRSVSSANAELRGMLEDYIRQQLPDRPDLLAHVIPAYPPGGKRFLRDNGVWLAALKRDHVHLITTPIAELTPSGIRTTDGHERAVDVVVYATGFKASDFLAGIDVVGVGGALLHDVWAGEARAYLGMCVPKFPNFFMLYGPNTNIVVNGSIIFFSECSMHYIMDVYRRMLGSKARAWSVRQEVYDQFNQRVDEANTAMAWGSAHVRSWYKSASGRVSQNWPYRLCDYWAATRHINQSDFESC